MIRKRSGKSAVENQTKSKPHFGFSKDQFVEAFRMSVSAIIAHKMRSLFNHARDYYRDYLRGFRRGIGKWFTTKILENIRGIGTSTITIFNGTGFGDRRAEQMQNLTINDATALNQQSYVQSVTPNSSSSGTLIYGNQTFSLDQFKRCR